MAILFVLAMCIGLVLFVREIFLATAALRLGFDAARSSRPSPPGS